MLNVELNVSPGLSPSLLTAVSGTITYFSAQSLGFRHVAHSTLTLQIPFHLPLASLQL